MPRAKPVQTMSQAEFAAHRGVSRKTVTKWKQGGVLVLTPAGQIDVAASDLLLDQRPDCYRGGVTHSAKAAAGNTTKVTASAGDEGDLTLAEAIRRKENYLGLLRKRELEISDGLWVRVEDVDKQVGREYAVIRERFLGLPGKMSGVLTPEQVARLDDEVREALTELSKPESLDAIADAMARQKKSRS